MDLQQIITLLRKVDQSSHNKNLPNDQTIELESIEVLGNMGVPARAASTEEKLSWLHSQIIGGDAEFDSPFGKRKLTYTDHTASSRCLGYIESYIITKVLPFYGNSHTHDSFVGHRTTKIAHEATQYVKKCLGGQKDDALIFCGSGTTASIKRLQEVMGIAIPSVMREKVLKYLPVEERWVVFVGPYEHHSNLLSWRQSLAEVVEIGFGSDGLMLDMEALRAQLIAYQRTNRPMLGSFSACSNVTGLLTDTRALSCLLHEFGAFACFDFAASGPYVEIDMRSGAMDGYDALFLSPHKFLGGPGSPGILMMNKALYQLGSYSPSTSGGGTVNYVNGFNEKETLYIDNIEEREDAGTPPIIQKIRAALAFWIKEYIGYKGIEKQEHYYLKTALERLGTNQNIEILGNKNDKGLAIFSFLIYTTSNSSIAEVESNGRNAMGGQLDMWREIGNKKDKPLHGRFVAKLLNDLFGIQARGGCACAGPYGHHLLNIDEPFSLSIRSAVQMGYEGLKPGWTRVSFPYYMSNEEFEFILAALEFIAFYGQRFLPIYNFNWKTGDWTLKKRALKETPHTNEQSYNSPGLAMTAVMLMQSLKLNFYASKKYGDENLNNPEVIEKYSSYLEIAKQIASVLPKFPTQSRIPKGINPDLIYFRI